MKLFSVDAHNVFKQSAQTLFFQYSQLAQIQPKSQFLFQKNLPPRDFSIMTLHSACFCSVSRNNRSRSSFTKRGQNSLFLLLCQDKKKRYWLHMLFWQNMLALRICTRIVRLYLNIMAIRVVEFSNWGVKNKKGYCTRINIPKGNYWILSIGLMASCQK